jgi:hypothetical protein
VPTAAGVRGGGAAILVPPLTLPLPLPPSSSTLSFSCCFSFLLLSPLLSSLPLRGAFGAVPLANSASLRAAKTRRQATLRSRLTTWTGL